MSRNSKNQRARGIQAKKLQKSMIKIGEPCVAQRIYDFTSKMTEEERAAVEVLDFSGKVAWLNTIIGSTNTANENK